MQIAWQAAVGAASVCAASATAAHPTTGWAASRAARGKKGPSHKSSGRCAACMGWFSRATLNPGKAPGAGLRSTCTTCPGRLPSRTATTQVGGCGGGKRRGCSPDHLVAHGTVFGISCCMLEPGCAGWRGHDPNYISFWYFANQLAKDQDVSGAQGMRSPQQ
jgi:hypothetical protein